MDHTYMHRKYSNRVSNPEVFAVVVVSSVLQRAIWAILASSAVY